MRLRSVDGFSEFHYAGSGRQTLEDFQAMYGGFLHDIGQISAGSSDTSILRSSASRITAYTSYDPQEPTKVALLIQEPQLTSQAARWTASAAYKAKHGIPFDSLRFEVPGLATYQAYERQQLSLLHIFSPKPRDFSVFPDIASGQRRIEIRAEKHLAAFENAAASYEMDSLDADQQNIRYTAIMDAAGTIEVPEEDPTPSVSVLAVEANNVLDGAHKLAHYYGEMRSHDDPNPRRTVAHALGATSLAYLQDIWNTAMTLQTPRDAGCYVVEQLVTQMH